MAQRIRRTLKEIEAGFPLAQKYKGISFEDWQAKQLAKPIPEKPLSKEAKQFSGKRIKRTKAEIEAGMPIFAKREGMTLGEWQAKQKEAQIKADEQNHKIQKTGPKFPDPLPVKQNHKDSFREVKEVQKIILETKNNKKEVKALFKEALERCAWEWKRINLDRDFKVSMLDKLGREGWKFAFMVEWPVIMPNSKKSNEILFQRPKT